jgi:hypothetical protein
MHKFLKVFRHQFPNNLPTMVRRLFLGAYDNAINRSGLFTWLIGLGAKEVIMRLRPLPLLLLLFVTGDGAAATTVPIPEPPKEVVSSSGDVEIYRERFGDHVDVTVKAKKAVYFHIFLSECNNCSDGFLQTTVSIAPGEEVRVGTVRQLDRCCRWSYRFSWDWEHMYRSYP